MNEGIRDEFTFSMPGIPVTRLRGLHLGGILILVPVTTLTFSQTRGRKRSTSAKECYFRRGRSNDDGQFGSHQHASEDW